MNMRSFPANIVLAFILATAGALAFFVTRAFGTPADAMTVAIAISFGGYVATLIHSAQGPGRVLTGAVWLVTTTVLSLAMIDVGTFVMLHIGGLWLARVLLTGISPVRAAVELAVTAIAGCSAVAVYAATISPWLSLWTFFLVHSLSLLIPQTNGSSTTNATDPGEFDRAFASADTAARKLATRTN